MFIPLKKVAFPKKFTALVLLFTLMFSHAAFARAASDPFEGQKVYYFLNDHLGSVDVVLDADGNVVERRDYLPYGSERSHIAEADESQRQRRASQQNAYQFTGQELDEETGLYYYGARYYDPVLGRFISPDPLIFDEAKKTDETLLSILENPQRLNAYTYALNNPVLFVDLWGESPFTDRWWGVGKAIDGVVKIVGGLMVSALSLDTSVATAGISVAGSGLNDIGLGISSMVKKKKIEYPNMVKNVGKSIKYPLILSTKKRKYGIILKILSDYDGYRKTFEATADMIEKKVTLKELGKSVLTTFPEIASDIKHASKNYLNLSREFLQDNTVTPKTEKESDNINKLK